MVDCQSGELFVELLKQVLDNNNLNIEKTHLSPIGETCWWAKDVVLNKVFVCRADFNSREDWK